jgi:hypothetical protein
LLINKGIPLRYRGKVYEACIRSVLLYGVETMACTKKLEDVLIGCDRRMLGYMAGITWRDRVSSVEVSWRCAVGELRGVLKIRRLMWFGHVRRGDEDGVLSRVVNVEVEGRRPPGRPKKS